MRRLLYTIAMTYGCSQHKVPADQPATEGTPASTEAITVQLQEHSTTKQCVELCLQASMAQARSHVAIQADCQRGCEAQISNKILLEAEANPASTKETE